MKKIFAVCAVLCMLFAAGCGSSEKAGELPFAETVEKYAVVSVEEESLLLCGTGENSGASALYTAQYVSEIFDVDGNKLSGRPLEAGQIIEIGYSGNIKESLPAQLDKPEYIRITENGSDLIGFYRDILKELYAEDEALNHEIEMIAFDLSKVKNLSDAQKSALIYIMGNECGFPTVSGTFDELCGKGYIDRENLYFEKGILFEIETEDEKEKSFVFSVSKWRSGLGAIGQDECKASLKNGAWSYKKGVMWIS